MGDGAEKPLLEKYVKQNSLERIVKFTGMLSHEEILSILTKSALHIVPSRLEPFGLSAIESIAEGAFTIVSDIDGLKEAVDGNALSAVFPKENVTALAILMTEKLSLKIDESFRKQESKKIVQKYSWTEAALQTRNLYKAIIS